MLEGPWAKQRVAVGLAIGVVVGLASPAAAGTWRVESRPPRFAAGPVQDGQRVWWVQAARSVAVSGAIDVTRDERPRVTLRSRSLRGADRVPVPVVLPLPPAGAATMTIDSLVVRGATARMVLRYCTADRPTPSCDDPTRLATIDVRTGAVVDVRTPAPDVPFGLGYGATPGGDTRRPRRLFDLDDGRPAITLPGRTFAATPRYAAANEGASELNEGGWSVLRVVDLRTNRTRYRVSARTVKRVALAGVRDRMLRTGGGTESPWGVGVVGVQPDGSLRLSVWRARGRGVQPVRITRDGKVRRVGDRLPGARAVRTSIAGRRALIESAGSRSCTGTWVTDLPGRRGARLRSRPSVDRANQVWWDGDSAVWSGWRVGAGPGSRDVLAGESGLGGRRLRARTRPRC